MPRQQVLVRLHSELVEKFDAEIARRKIKDRTAAIRDLVEQFVDTQPASQLEPAAKQNRGWVVYAALLVVLPVASASIAWNVRPASSPPAANNATAPPAMADNSLLDPSIANFAANVQARLARNEEKRRIDPAGRDLEVSRRLERSNGVDRNDKTTSRID